MPQHALVQIDREQSERNGSPMKGVLLEGPDRSTATGSPPTTIDLREERLFRSLDVDNDRQVLRRDLEARLAQAGLRANDVRLHDSMSALDALRREEEAAIRERLERPIPRDGFCQAIRHNILLIERALQGNLIIPDFASFCEEFDRIHAITGENKDGAAANYIPQLDLKEPALDQWGAAVCTIDGQHHSVGDAGVFFPVESMCKPVSYCLALEEHGPDLVHSYIGHEPSGGSFNELALNKENRPHNPMINAGAILSSAMIKLGSKQRLTDAKAMTEMDARGWAGSRFDFVMERWQALCGGEKPRFSTPVYLSERETADRNFAIAYYMREKGAFPHAVDLDDVLDLYFQSCSIELTAEMMSVVAATLANGGICPATGERVFATQTVQHCLSLMSSCGMYDYSGEFAFAIGLPAKSGVSGGIMIVIPNVMGICVWSPRLDQHGNSVRGLEFCRHLVDRFNFHNFDMLAGASGKTDPRISRTRLLASSVNELIWAASKGDLGAIHHQLLRGAKLSCADYDRRTPLHLAAAENQIDVVKFFIEEKRRSNESIDLNPRDRWGGTPLDDAYLHGNEAIIELLECAGGVRGATNSPTDGDLRAVSPSDQAESHRAAELIWAASEGDLTAICCLVAQGMPLDIADYDLRTPLHLAAAEGHLTVVDYFIAQQATPDPRDRWGHTPLDDDRS
jgi:glutaminase